MASTLQALIGRFDINVDNQSYDVDGNGINTTAGKYFVSGHTGEAATNNLLATMQAAIVALGAGYTSVTCTLDLATGFVTIGNFDANATVTWTDTNLRDLLGFTATLSGATTYTGTKPARYLWRPNKGLSEYPVTLDAVFAPESATMVGATRDGTIMTARQTTVYGGEYEWQLIQESDAIIPATGSINREFEQFFTDIIAAGERVRFVFDRTSYASTGDFVTVTIFPGDDPEPTAIGPVQDYLTRAVDGNLALWDVRFYARKFV